MKDLGFRVLEFRVDLGLEFRVVFGSVGFGSRFYGWWFEVENKRLGFLEISSSASLFHISPFLQPR